MVLKKENTNQYKLSSKVIGLLGVPYVFFIFFFSQIIAGVIVLIFPLLSNHTYKSSITWINNSTNGQFLFIFLAEGIAVGLVFLFLKFFRLKRTSIGIKRFSWNDLLYGILGYLGYFALYVILILAVNTFTSLNLNQKQDVGFNNVHGSMALILTFISLVILAPIGEEILVRGLLYTSFKKVIPVIYAAIMTSLLFGFAHLGEGVGGLLWIGFLDTFILSLVLIYLREKTNGLYAGMFAHGLKNFVAYVSLFLAPVLSNHIR